MAILVLRRPDHIKHPAVWDEDGVVSLPDFLQHGWRTLDWTINGYLTIPSRLLTAVAATISFDHYATVAIVLSLIIQAACVTAVAWAPTLLPLPVLCALFTVLIPTDPEVLLTPLYVFWWTGLLVFLALLWRNDAPQTPRLAFIALAGVSSPMIIAQSAVFVARAAVERNRGNVIAAATAVGFALLQTAFFAAGDLHPPEISLDTLEAVIRSFFGIPILAFGANDGQLLACGLFVVAVLIAGIATLPKHMRLPFILLGAGLSLSILASIARVPVTGITVFSAGPRYFFYPLILTGWMLIWLGACAPRTHGVVAGVLLEGMMMLLPQVLIRHHDKLPWKPQAEACAAATGPYTFIIHFAGSRADVWKQDIPGDACRKAMARQLF